MKRNVFRVVSYGFLLLLVATSVMHPSQTNAALEFCGSAGYNVPGCKGTQGLTQIISGVLNVVFFLSFLLVLFFLVWGGLKWVLAQGEKEGITKAREQVTNSLIGLVVILGSYLLLNLALQLVLGQKLSDLNVIDLNKQVGN